MESGNFYVNRNINNRSGPRTQSHSQNEGNARKQSKQKVWFEAMAVMGIANV